MWMSAGNAVRAVLKIGVVAILARLLTPEDFGLVAAAGIVVWLGGLFASLGAGPALLQRRDIEPRHTATGFAISIGLGITLAAIVYLGAPLFAALLRIDDLAPVLRALSPIFPIGAVAVVAESLLLRELRFGRVIWLELLSYALGYGVVGIALAVSGAGVWSLVGAELSKAVIKSALFVHAMPHALRIGGDRAAFRELMVFGSGYTIGGLSTYFAAQADSFVVARFLGAGPLGLYGRAYELMLAPATALGTVLDKILLPTMARVQDDVERLRTAYRRCTALVALLVLPLGAATAVLAPEIIASLLGQGWEGAVMPLRVLAVAMYFRVGYMVGYSVANAVGAVYSTAARGTAFALLVLLGALVGQRWGIVGVSAGVAAAVTVNFLSVLHLGMKITRTTWADVVAVHLPAVLLSAIVGVTASLLAELLRERAVPAPYILLSAALLTMPLVIVLLRAFPARLLGDEGRWVIDTLWRSAPRQLQPMLRRLLVSGGGER